MNELFDVVVVGAGIFGSCTAYHSQNLGQKTLLLEQFSLGHSNGSSHGKSRIIRYAHEERAYIPLVHDAYTQIAQLEKRTNHALWKKTGLLWTAPAADIQKISNNLKAEHFEHEVLEGSQINGRYPQFVFTNEFSGLIDPFGGVIYADKWLKTFQDEFRTNGGIIRDNVAVEGYRDDNEFVHLETSNGPIRTRKVVFTPGAWLGKVIPNLPINVNPMSIAVCYWKTKEEKDNFMTEIGHFPVYIGSDENNMNFSRYALPAIDYPHAIKLCQHHGERIMHGGDHPSQTIQEHIDFPSTFIAKHLPRFSPQPCKVDKCKYTNSDDDHYVIDYLPGSKNILIAACGSGSGFKVAPGIGRAAAEMALGRKTTVDVSFFSFKRFNQKSKI